MALVATVLVLSACAGGGQSPASGELTVFAAASLSGALDRLRPAFEAASPGVHLTMSSGSSAALRAQIEQGAPADVFLSADTSNPDALHDAGLVDREVVRFATNELVLIVPTGNPAAIDTPADLAREGARIVAAGDDVPISGYADRIVQQLAQLPGYPSDFAARYRANTVSREENVAAVRTKIELGEGDGAFVYATDAVASDGVEIVELPAGVGVRASYGGVVLRSAADREVARRFLDWIAAPDSQAILADLGFGPP